MNILITSGSIVETIDDVYYIGQKTDASIGAIIGESFSKETDVENVFFVYGDKSRFPWESASAYDQKFFFDEWADKVSLYPVSDLETCKTTVKKLFEANEIHAVIHLMSIPNYGQTSVHLLKDADDASSFVHQLAREFGFQAVLSIEPLNGRIESSPSTYGKMKTGYQQAILTQYPQEKLTTYLQSLANEQTIWVTGKFEYNVTEDALLELAASSLAKNKSHMVVATDIESYKKGDEEGYYIVDTNHSISKRCDAEELADALVHQLRPENR